MTTCFHLLCWTLPAGLRSDKNECLENNSGGGTNLTEVEMTCNKTSHLRELPSCFHIIAFRRTSVHNHVVFNVSANKKQTHTYDVIHTEKESRLMNDSAVAA